VDGCRESSSGLDTLAIVRFVYYYCCALPRRCLLISISLASSFLWNGPMSWFIFAADKEWLGALCFSQFSAALNYLSFRSIRHFAEERDALLYFFLFIARGDDAQIGNARFLKLVPCCERLIMCIGKRSERIIHSTCYRCPKLIAVFDLCDQFVINAAWHACKMSNTNSKISLDYNYRQLLAYKKLYSE
jgi:hypothetical protein